MNFMTGASPTNNEFVVQVTGIYRLHCNFSFVPIAGGGADHTFSLQCFVNGAVVPGKAPCDVDQIGTVGDFTTIIDYATTLSLTAGDTVNMRFAMTFNTGGAITSQILHLDQWLQQIV